MHHLQSANVCLSSFGSDNGKEISFEKKYGKLDLLVSKYTLPFRPFRKNIIFLAAKRESCPTRARLALASRSPLFA